MDCSDGFGVRPREFFFLWGPRSIIFRIQGSYLWNLGGPFGCWVFDLRFVLTKIQRSFTNSRTLFDLYLECCIFIEVFDVLQNLFDRKGG